MSNQDLPVRLKGVGDALWVTLDPALSIDTLKPEISKLFERLRHLAVNARVIIDTGGKPTEDGLIEDIGAFLQERFQVGHVSTPPQPKKPPVQDHAENRPEPRKAKASSRN